MAVVEVFVADEDIVEVRRSTGEMFAEQIGVEGEVDRVRTDLETAAAGPFQENRAHGRLVRIKGES